MSDRALLLLSRPPNTTTWGWSPGPRHTAVWPRLPTGQGSPSWGSSLLQCYIQKELNTSYSGTSLSGLLYQSGQTCTVRSVILPVTLQTLFCKYNDASTKVFPMYPFTNTQHVHRVTMNILLTHHSGEVQDIEVTGVPSSNMTSTKQHNMVVICLCEGEQRTGWGSLSRDIWWGPGTWSLDMHHHNQIAIQDSLTKYSHKPHPQYNTPL